jgi:hypothetical protein
LPIKSRMQCTSISAAASQVATPLDYRHGPNEAGTQGWDFQSLVNAINKTSVFDAEKVRRDRAQKLWIYLGIKSSPTCSSMILGVELQVFSIHSPGLGMFPNAGNSLPCPKVILKRKFYQVHHLLCSKIEAQIALKPKIFDIFQVTL